jgi:hypothetical protein
MIGNISPSSTQRPDPEGAGQAGEEFRLGMARREGQTHALGGCDDVGRDPNQTQAQWRKLGLR